MPSTSAFPFHFTRSRGEYTGMEYLSTTERIDGLLRLDGDRLVVQWRAARDTQRMGVGYSTDREVDPVREAVLPLSALAGAELRERGWGWFSGATLVLTAADLRAFEEVAGNSGMKLDHPATLSLAVRRGDRLAAREFAADLNLALAERALQPGDAPGALSAPPPPPLPPAPANPSAD